MLIQGFLDTQLPQWVKKQSKKRNQFSSGDLSSDDSFGATKKSGKGKLSFFTTGSRPSSAQKSSKKSLSSSIVHYTDRCYFVLRYNKIKNCSSLSCYWTDKITPLDTPIYTIDMYHVTCVIALKNHVIEIVSLSSHLGSGSSGGGISDDYDGSGGDNDSNHRSRNSNNGSSSSSSGSGGHSSGIKSSTPERISLDACHDHLMVQCPDTYQFRHWMTHLEHVRSMSLFTCERHDVMFSNISSDMLTSLTSLYNSVVQSLKFQFSKHHKSLSNSSSSSHDGFSPSTFTSSSSSLSVGGNSGNQASKLVLSNSAQCSQKMIKQYGPIRVLITPCSKFDFTNRFEERSTTWWNAFREQYHSHIVFSDSEIPRSPADDSNLKNIFYLGDPIYGRAYWPHALRNYALAKLIKEKKKSKEVIDLIYGPAFRTVHSLFILVFLKVDGVYLVGEGEIEKQFNCWSHGNFGSIGAIQSDQECASEKVDFWAFNQTIKIPVFNFDSISNPDSWEVASQNFVKLSLQFPLGKNYEIEYEMRFMLRNPSTNSQIEPTFDTKISAPISTGAFTLVVPNPDSSSPRGPKKIGEWIARLPRETTLACDKCSDKLEKQILEHLKQVWVEEVYNKARVPLHLYVSGPRILLATKELAIPVKVFVYHDPRHGWKNEFITVLETSMSYKVKTNTDSPPLSARGRKRQDTRLSTFSKQEAWLCEYCDSPIPHKFDSIITHEEKAVGLDTVPDRVWSKIDRCPERLRLIL